MLQHFLYLSALLHDSCKLWNHWSSWRQSSIRSARIQYSLTSFFEIFHVLLLKQAQTGFWKFSVLLSAYMQVNKRSVSRLCENSQSV